MKKLKTRWTDTIDKNNVLTEYPRPALVRESYVNLNGLWEYAVTDKEKEPRQYDGEILVPFSPEAPLSGVERQLKPREYLWYKRMLPAEIKPSEGKRWLLHFGAVDQYAAVKVNGRIVKRHLGGYLPFSADITEKLKEEENVLQVMVWDDSDTSYYSRGKQKLKRGGMFYTAQSGIWQTVWAEQVPGHYILHVKAEPLWDEKILRLTVRDNESNGAGKAGQEGKAEITVSTDDGISAQVIGTPNEPIMIELPDMHSWSPEDPYLYYIDVTLGADHVTSYTAMRKLHVEKDENGIPRIFLNNKPYFQRGILDQGYWPDGLYTPPCDEAMRYDIRLAKRLGFNMMRKHLKIEPQRWYYHCDREGMLVWQDMVCGGRSYKSWYVTYLATAMEFLHIRMPDFTLGLLGRKDEKGRRQFEAEMRETTARLSHHPSIAMWVIFNEGWGQFHAGRLTQMMRELDGTRLIDQASGWFDQGGGDVRSIHDYFFPLKVSPEKERASVLSEYGGYSLRVKGHFMCQKEYGYRKYADREELTKGYEELIRTMVLPNIPRGLSAAVYTQLSDVEEEVNGIATYDREIIKIEEKTLQRLNEMQHL